MAKQSRKARKQEKQKALDQMTQKQYQTILKLKKYAEDVGKNCEFEKIPGTNNIMKYEEEVVNEENVLEYFFMIGVREDGSVFTTCCKDLNVKEDGKETAAKYIELLDEKSNDTTFSLDEEDDDILLVDVDYDLEEMEQLQEDFGPCVFGYVRRTLEYCMGGLAALLNEKLTLEEAVDFGKKEQRHMAMPGVLLWLLCEFVLFQPNSYDNNKLLLVAYLFFCIATADYVWDTLPQQFARLGRFVRPAAVTVTAVLGVFAAILTMGREWVSDYELYDNGYVKACQWVEKNTQPTDTFLTATNHNNAIASLTGRNIVCGSSSFLYYHGVDYTGNEAAVKSMYEDPDVRDSLLDEYGVNYIVIGPWELGSYQISDYDTLASSYEIVYSQDNIVILAVNDR